MPVLSIPISTSIEIAFDCECEECKSDLVAELVAVGGLMVLRVRPCGHCMTSEMELGYDKGYKEGEEAGLDSGFDAGQKQGHKEGYNAGHADGYENAQQDLIEATS